MISCGEPSGDLYAGALVRALRLREPTLEVFGTYPAQSKEPPADLVAKIKTKRPDWEGYK